MSGVFPQMLESSIGNATDSYKLTHWKIYPKGLTKLYSYLEARAPSDFANKTVFFGLQYFIKRYLKGQVIFERELPRLKAFCKHHFYGVEGLFNEQGWKYVIDKHQGCLPVSIAAVPEGTVVPTGNVLMTIENTDPNCSWLTNFLETILVEVWNGITVASLSRAMKETQYHFMKMTVDDCLIPILMPSRVHDFGYRGVSSPETAAISGASHLVNFAGTDTIRAIDLINQFYCGNEYEENERDDLYLRFDPEKSFARWDEFYAKHMPGFSIPATEHSQMTLEGPEGEAAVCARLLSEFPDGFVACVSDSFDLFNCINEIWGTKLKEQVLNRNGTLVVRPDSGEPTEIVPAVLKALGEKFGFTTNSKGYKVLNSKVRVIQGDGVNFNSHYSILNAVACQGWSAENLAFGSGGALLQKVNRDTFSFAFKGCYCEIDGVSRDVYKAPKTDPKKNSKRGRLALVKDHAGVFCTVPESDAVQIDGGNLLTEVFRDGKLVKEYSFSEIRQRAELPELLPAAMVACK